MGGDHYTKHTVVLTAGVVKGVTHGGDMSLPKVLVGGTQYTVPPLI